MGRIDSSQREEGVVLGEQWGADHLLVMDM